MNALIEILVALALGSALFGFPCLVWVGLKILSEFEKSTGYVRAIHTQTVLGEARRDRHVADRTQRLIGRAEKGAEDLAESMQTRRRNGLTPEQQSALKEGPSVPIRGGAADRARFPQQGPELGTGNGTIEQNGGW